MRKTINIMKSHPSKSEKILVINISDKELISKTYKELIKFNIQKDLILKMGGGPE